MSDTQLPTGIDPIMRPKAVARIFGVSTRTLWRMVQDERIPPPKRIGRNVSGWHESTIKTCSASLPDARKKAA